MANNDNEPVNEVNQSEQHPEDQYMTKQDIENIVAQGIANAIPIFVAAIKSPNDPQHIIPSKHTIEDNFSNSINGGNDHINHDNESQHTPLPKK